MDELRNDRHLGMTRRITRRDFLNGVAIGAAASLTSPFWLPSLGSAEAEFYPPALTGLRGSNEGSFEIAHQLRDGKLQELFQNVTDTGERYDLVVVGAGLSGLAAACFFRKAAGKSTKILILDNHDDFGGHARRQEFGKGKSFLIGHGGSFAIESPAPYSKVSKNLIQELGIDVDGFRKHASPDFYSSFDLHPGFFFDQATYGKNVLLPDPFEGHYEWGGEAAPDSWNRFLERAPWTDSAKKDLLRLHNESIDYLPGLNSAEKKAKLATISYAKFVTEIAKCDPSILPYFQSRPHSLFGAGIDIVPAQDAWGLGYPGFQGMKLDPEPGPGMNRDCIRNEEAESYFFHYPDGNASIARLLVRQLIPDAVPGKTAEDVVMARTDYRKLDRKDALSRIRLSSTVVRVTNSESGQVEVTYVRGGKCQKIIASNCVLACWHTVIPYLCPEMPQEQKTALAYAIKVPLLYARVAVRNWMPWIRLKIQSVYAPGMYFTSIHLPMPLSFEGYRTAQDPTEPVVIGMLRTPCRPGLPIRHQHRLGRGELLATNFESYERKIRDQLLAILGPGGFDTAKDITGIAVHRWPHGYAYQYNSIADPFWLQGKEGPCAAARKLFGRIAIANSDSGAYAYVDSALDHAHRAIQELLSCD
jgi:spermidine dehydrogenase